MARGCSSDGAVGAGMFVAAIAEAPGVVAAIGQARSILLAPWDENSAYTLRTTGIHRNVLAR